jgi:hypothetical protein
MVLTKPELVASLQKEVRILLHLAGKIDRTQLDYRPTPKQRSTQELLQYLSMMGPFLVRAGKAGAFDPAAWTAAEAETRRRDIDQTIAAIAAQADQYETLLAGVSDADLRSDVTMFGTTSSLGGFLVNSVLAGCAAYRTQLFLYLKVCGQPELGTMNLWAGADAPVATA